MVEGFVVNGDINVLGKTSDRGMDFRERRAALERHWKASRHSEESLEHPADPNILLQVLRSQSEFSSTRLQYAGLLVRG